MLPREGAPGIADLLGVAAHDVGSPLAAIISLTDLLASPAPSPDPQRTGKLVAAVGRQAVVMDAMVGGLIDALKVAHGIGRETESEPLGVAGLVDGALELLPDPWPSAIEVDVGEGARARGDEDRAVRVLRCIVLNAARSGSTRISVTCERQAEAVVLVVADDRQAIPDAVEGELDPVDLGLDLAVAAHLAPLFGGSVSVAPGHAGGVVVRFGLDARGSLGGELSESS